MTKNEQNLLEVKHLKKYFKTSFGVLHAVDDINLSINQGETLGVVGESGCGKSTLGRVILRLIDATDGEVLYRGENVLSYKGAKLKEFHQKMQIIFQDPYSSLNPRFTVSELIADPIKVNGIVHGNIEINKRVRELMDTVGLASRLENAYPHELDGGRRQRIGIARALSVRPEFIVCDEPVSSLDVSIQAQILNLLMDLQDEYGYTYMFITHDLSVVKHISNNIAVMYLGQCIEYAPTKELFANPLHPYTKGLLASIPIPRKDAANKKKIIIKGEVSNPIDPKPGCRFSPRCEECVKKCHEKDIPLKSVGNDHFVSCALYE